ncbi:MAG: phosphate ABC transporter substrate-binding protein PstS [Candidatus Schekmanbacteria bacterium]|nr:MAG: phosphate ABC transporter substrate-binding protein PstS [Candidatus Schekmanbacteria bacterium]
MKISKFLFYTICILSLIIVPISSARASENDLLGAGATFPYPLYSKLFDVYYKKTGVRINYQSIGSGGGVRQIFSKTVDFGASDAFLSDEELKKAPAEIIHIPTCLGAVTVSYNIIGDPQIKLTPSLLADIFMGKITKWNDIRIQNINQDVKLPSLKIVVVHRSDGSGTTAIFTDYLSKVSIEWKQRVGAGKSVRWPAGIGAKGNEGVSGMIKQIPGTIGYIELAYAMHNRMKTAAIQNKSGKFILPTLESTSLAANTNIPDDTRISITDTDSPDGYPISGFTWILVYKNQNYKGRSFLRAKNLVNLLWWIINEGQTFTKPLDYAPLPEKAKKKAEKLIKSITYGNETILK